MVCVCVSEDIAYASMQVRVEPRFSTTARRPQRARSYRSISRARRALNSKLAGCYCCCQSMRHRRQWRREGVCRPGQTSVLAPLPVRSATDILMVTTMALVWTVTNSTLSWGCNYIMQIPTESVLQCKASLPETAKYQNSIFSPLRMPPPAQCRPGRMPPSPLPSRRH